MKRLIVNADDFGISEKRNLGIIEAHRFGVVTSVSLLANGPAFDHAVALARECPRLDVGLHLNLTEGSPCASGLQTLVGMDGRFFGKSEARERATTGRFSIEEVERETEAQIARLVAAGLPPSHIDGHQHIHIYGRLAGPIARAAGRAGIRWFREPVDKLADVVPIPAERAQEAVEYARMALVAALPFREHGLICADRFGGIALTGRIAVETIVSTITHLRDGVTELMVHPGYADAPDGFSGPDRERELKALTDARVAESLRRETVELTVFGPRS